MLKSSQTVYTGTILPRFRLEFCPSRNSPVIIEYVGLSIVSL